MSPNLVSLAPLLIAALVLPIPSSAASLSPVGISLGAYDLDGFFASGMPFAASGDGAFEETLTAPGATGAATIALREDAGGVILEHFGQSSFSYGITGIIELILTIPDFGLPTTAVAIRPTLTIDEGSDVFLTVETQPFYASSILASTVAGTPAALRDKMSTTSLDDYVAGDEIRVQLLIPSINPALPGLSKIRDLGPYHQRVRLEAFAITSDTPYVPEPGASILYGAIALAAWGLRRLHAKHGPRPGTSW